MTVEEIKAKYEAEAPTSQIEFERMMQDINAEQTHLNHPYLDRQRELVRQKKLLKLQMTAICTQLDAIKLEYLDVEQKRKDINRQFYDLKHDLFQKYPADSWKKEESHEDMD